ERSGTESVKTAAARGGRTRTIRRELPGAHIDVVGWTRDEAHVIIERRAAPSRTSDLFTIGPDGSDLRRLVSTPEQESEPEWSPDGTTVAFSRYIPRTKARASYSEIYTTRASGAGERAVAASPSASVSSPSWSPDGLRLAFVQDHNIFTIDARGGTSR